MKRVKQAPVFKPLTTTENFETCSTNLKTGVVPGSFMKTNESQVGSHSRIVQDSGTERLSTLHAKLHQEADKIRKWKIQTEIELKQKEKKIQDISTTNESLRKSILELQLQNENLSLKLQEELGNREDVFQRICSTRHLCNVLKDHTTKLEEKLHHCETEKTELKYLEKEHLQQYEELSSGFKKLEKTSTESSNKLARERDDHIKQEKELQRKLEDAEEKLKALMDQCDEKDIEIGDIRATLQRNDDKIHTLEKNIYTLQERLDQQMADIHSKETDLEAASEQLFNTKREKLDFEEKFTDICEKLENLKMEKSTVEHYMESSKADYDSNIKALQQMCDELKSKLQDQMQKALNYENQVGELRISSENLKSSKDILMMENTTLEGTKSVMNQELIECHGKLKALTSAHAILTDSYSQLHLDFEKCKSSGSQIQNTLENERLKLMSKNNELITIQQKLHSLEEKIKVKEVNIVTSEKHFKSLEAELQSVVENKNEMHVTLLLEQEKNRKQTLQCQKLKDEINELKEKQAEQMNEMKTELEGLLQEKKDTLNKCDFQLSEMMSTMEKYKKENKKIVQNKDKEIEMLKSKSEQFSVLKQKELLGKLARQEQSMEQLEMKIEMKEEEIIQLKSNLQSAKKEEKEDNTRPKKDASAMHRQTPTSPQVPNTWISKTSKTPQMTHVSSYDELAETMNSSTPPQSILRNMDYVPKRRKVAFVSHDDSGRHSDSDSSFEVVFQNMQSKSKNLEKSTPQLIRPSPKARLSPKDDQREITGQTPLTRVPRGPSAKIHFKENEQDVMTDVGHVRKTPSKNTSKFFRESPKEKYSKKSKLTEKGDIAWFDNDNVFGFEV